MGIRNIFSSLILINAILLFLSGSLLSQMPDWFFFRDSEGNGYYYDRAFRIRITESKNFSYEPVTAEGIDYYFNSGIDLIQAGRMSEGLFYLKSIRLLKAGGSRVDRLKAEATKWINALYQKEGSRFLDADTESTVLLVKNNNIYEFFNEKLFYRMTFGYRPSVVRCGWKNRGTAYGVKIGVNTGNSGQDEGYDYMLGVESRVYRGRVESVDEAERIFRFEAAGDLPVRQELVRSEDRVVYTYEYPGDAKLCGVEAYFVNRQMIHMVRGICHDNLKDRVFEEMKKNITGIVLVRQP